VAAAAPFNFTGTTLGGDLYFNSTAAFRLGAAAGGYDVFSVALHEAGHALGLDHSDDPASVLREGYRPYTGLGAVDVAAVRALYGARAPDAFDAAGANDTRATADAMPWGESATQLLADGDLTTLADADHYKFTIGLAAAPTAFLLGVTVRLKASGISLLAPRVTVYNSAGQVVASGASTDVMNNDVALHFRPGLLGGTYTVKVDNATADVFGVGGYRLAVDYLSLSSALAPLTSAVAHLVDGHSDDSLLSALGLAPQPRSTADARFDFVYRGVVEDGADVDTFRVR
jgi:hypothetical protein